MQSTIFKNLSLLCGVALASAAASCAPIGSPPVPASGAPPATVAPVSEKKPAIKAGLDTVNFAVIGDYGNASKQEEGVANLVKGWPELNFILTVGDNNYQHGLEKDLGKNITNYYGDFITPYRGDRTAWLQGEASQKPNRFFPSLGNHDWGNKTDPMGAEPYLKLFFPVPLGPGQGRYYDFVQGPIHFFAINSDKNEPDGVSPTGVQAQWLKAGLAAAREPWKVVYFHHTPYTSSLTHAHDTWMRWPYKEWGASVVLAGHVHNYERFEIDGLPYFVDGLGGAEQDAYEFQGTLYPGSRAHLIHEFGALFIKADAKTMAIQLRVISDPEHVRDTLVLKRPGG